MVPAKDGIASHSVLSYYLIEGSAGTMFSHAYGRNEQNLEFIADSFAKYLHTAEAAAK